MGLGDTLKIGELMDIEAQSGRARTKLQEILEDDDFTILHPTIKGVPLRPEPDEPVRFTFCRDDGVYEFDALILSMFRNDDIRLCLCRPVTEIKQTQRRQYYRLPIVLTVYMEKRDDTTGARKRYKAKTIDLSENAMQMSCFTAFSPGTEFDLKIQLTVQEAIDLGGTVVRCQSPLVKEDPYKMVMVFEEQAPPLKAKLRRYIFDRQIIERKKEMNKLS